MEGSDDDDVFKGEFSLEKTKTREAPSEAARLSSKVQKVLGDMEKNLVATIPRHLSEPSCCTYLDSLSCQSLVIHIAACTLKISHISQVRLRELDQDDGHGRFATP